MHITSIYNIVFIYSFIIYYVITIKLFEMVGVYFLVIQTLYFGELKLNRKSH